MKRERREREKKERRERRGRGKITVTANKIFVILQRAIAGNIFCEYNTSYIAAHMIGMYFF